MAGKPHREHHLSRAQRPGGLLRHADGGYVQCVSRAAAPRSQASVSFRRDQRHRNGDRRRGFAEGRRPLRCGRVVSPARCGHDRLRPQRPRGGADQSRNRMAAHDRSEPGAASQSPAADPDLGQLRRSGSGWRSLARIWRVTPLRSAAWPPSTRWGWSTVSPRSRATWPRAATQPTCCRGAIIPTARGTSWWRENCFAGSRSCKAVAL